MLQYMILSLNVTMPFILIAALGFFIKRRGMIDDNLIKQGNKIVFNFGIPATIFNNIYRADMSEVFDAWFLTFNSLWLIVFFLATWGMTWIMMEDKSSVATFVNTAYRGSLPVVALPLLVLMFYDAYDPNILPKGILTAAVLQILTISAAVVLFAVHDPAARKKGVLGVTVSILKNPLVICIAVGLIFNAFGWTLPTFAATTVNGMSGIMMPLAMICIGANISFRGFDQKFKYVTIATAVKLLIMPVTGVLVAYLFGFRGSDLTIIMILNALPMAVGAYVMQAELGGDTYISASVLMITMVLSAFTLTLFIFLFRVMGFLV